MVLEYKDIIKCIFRSSCIYQSDFLPFFVEELKPKIVLELGTYRGISTIVLASIAEKVYTFDIIHQTIAEELWKVCLVDKKIEYHTIKTIYDARDYMKNIAVDFAFIDITHEQYEHLNKTFDMLYQLGVRRMLFDGVYGSFPASQRLAKEKNMKILHNKFGYWEGK